MEEKYIQTEYNPFEMLEELLWQDQFELVFPETESNQKKEYGSNEYRSKEYKSESAELQECKTQENNSLQIKSQAEINEL